MTENLIFKIIEKIPVFQKRFHRISHDIAGYLDNILIEKDIKQKEFASMMKKSESEISKWLSGYHNFTIKTISRIEAELDIEILQIPFYEKKELEKINFKYNTNSNMVIELPSDNYLSIYKPNDEERLYDQTANESTNMIFNSHNYKKAVNS